MQSINASLYYADGGMWLIWDGSDDSEQEPWEEDEGGDER